MAYKFQRGSFTASGSINVEDALTGSGTVTLGNAATDLVSVVGDASFDNDVTLGNAQGDVTTVSGQLTSSFGIMIADTMEVGFAGDGALDFSAATTGKSKLVLKDNLAEAFHVAEGSNDYLTFVTTNSSEAVKVSQDLQLIDGKGLDFAGDGSLKFGSATTGQSGLAMADNLAQAFYIHQGGNNYLKFTTTDNLESMTAGVTLTGSVFSGSTVGAFVGDGSKLTNVDISSLALSRGYVWIGDSSGEAAAVDANDDGQILIGDGTDLNSVAVSGDVTISSAGAVTIANNAVETAMLNTGSVTRPKIGADAVGPEQMLLFDDGLIPTTTHFLIADGTDYSSFALSGDITCTNAGVTTIGAGVVDNAMLANDYMIIGGTTVDLGDTITAITALTDIDMTAGDHTIFDTVAANTLTLGAATTTIAVPGELEVGSSIFFSGLSVLGAGTNQILTSTSSYVVVQGSASAVTVKLPATPDEGTWFAIKRSAKMSAALTLDYNSGKQIDGDTSIVLETAGAAVTLVYEGTTQNWNIF